MNDTYRITATSGTRTETATGTLVVHNAAHVAVDDEHGARQWFRRDEWDTITCVPVNRG